MSLEYKSLNPYKHKRVCTLCVRKTVFTLLLNLIKRRVSEQPNELVSLYVSTL